MLAALAAGVSACGHKPTGGVTDAGVPPSASASAVIPPPEALPKPPAPKVVTVSVAHFHACALMEDKTIRCWGTNDDGELGDGKRNGNVDPEYRSKPPLTNVSQVVCGGESTCALVEDGSTYCWGDNIVLGTTATPQRITELPAATQISNDGMQVCALRADATVWCTSPRDYETARERELSADPYHHEPPRERERRLPMSGLTAIISLNDQGSCALRRDGALFCWGTNTGSRLGYTKLDAPDSYGPFRVPLTRRAVEFNTAGGCQCARLDDGSKECWPGGRVDLCPPKTKSHHVVHVEKIKDEFNLRQTGYGNQHACGLGGAASVFCWGKNDVGQIGLGRIDGPGSGPEDTFGSFKLYPPTSVPMSGKIVSLSASADRTCALLDDNSLWCWGGWNRRSRDPQEEQSWPSPTLVRFSE